MKRYLLVVAVFAFVACNAHTANKETKEATPAPVEQRDTMADAILEEAADGGKEDRKKSKADTFCYVISDGESNENINAVKLIILGDKVTGELKYITANEPPAAGKLEGTIKGGIITADWMFIKEKKFYKIPVAFKMTKNAVFQKPSAVNQDGQAYIPEEGEYEYEFPLVNCDFYPR